MEGEAIVYHSTKKTEITAYETRREAREAGKKRKKSNTFGDEGRQARVMAEGGDEEVD
jgi:hypothetical protein